MGAYLWMICVLLFAGATPVFAGAGPVEKTDLVVLSNGNEILGEIKSLSQGNLTFKTDSAGTLTIEWDEILRLTSRRRFRFEFVDGRLLIGSLLDPPQEKALLIQQADGELSIVPMVEVARLREFDESAWERVDGYLNAGFTYTKSSSLAQYSLGAGFKYLEDRHSISVDTSFLLTDSKNQNKTEKADLSSSYRRILKGRWFGLGILDLTHNSELGLEFRATMGAGPGRYLFESQIQDLSAFGGLAYSYEVPKGEPSSGEVESFLGTSYNLYVNDSPSANLALNWLVFPGITRSNRFRTTLNISLNKEVFGDFYFNLSYYLDYDSDPSSDAGADADYGIVTGVSYTF